MIAKLTGKVDYIRNNYVVLEVNGVGYKLFMTALALARLSAENEHSVFVHTHVREDQITLYGFLNLSELEMFELLILVSGVGPKAGLNLLAIAGADAIKTAISNEDPSMLTKIPGIGKKTAQRIIIDLKNKIEELPSAYKEKVTIEQEVIEALMAMGYNSNEAREALKNVPKETADVSEKIRLALRSMRK